jgi:hypothetical protein
MAWLTAMCGKGNSLVLDTVPPADTRARVFERSLILKPDQCLTSRPYVGFNSAISVLHRLLRERHPKTNGM